MDDVGLLYKSRAVNVPVQIIPRFRAVFPAA